MFNAVGTAAAAATVEEDVFSLLFKFKQLLPFKLFSSLLFRLVVVVLCRLNIIKPAVDDKDEPVGGCISRLFA